MCGAGTLHETYRYLSPSFLSDFKPFPYIQLNANSAPQPPPQVVLEALRRPVDYRPLPAAPIIAEQRLGDHLSTECPAFDFLDPGTRTQMAEVGSWGWGLGLGLGSPKKGEGAGVWGGCFASRGPSLYLTPNP